MGHFEYKSMDGTVWELDDDPECLVGRMFSDGLLFREERGGDISVKSPFGVWMMTEGAELVMKYAIKYIERELLDCIPFITWMARQENAPVVGEDYSYGGEEVAEWVEDDDE